MQNSIANTISGMKNYPQVLHIDATATGTQLRQRLKLIGGAVEGFPEHGHRLSAMVDKIEADMRWLSLLAALARYLAPDFNTDPYPLACDIAQRLSRFETAHHRIILGHRQAQNETERLMLPLMAFGKKRSERTIFKGLKNLFQRE